MNLKIAIGMLVVAILLIGAKAITDLFELQWNFKQSTWQFTAVHFIWRTIFGVAFSIILEVLYLADCPFLKRTPASRDTNGSYPTIGNPIVARKETFDL